jgi:hypothetical protein
MNFQATTTPTNAFAKPAAVGTDRRMKPFNGGARPTANQNPTHVHQAPSVRRGGFGKTALILK